jgi:hypothetical protein
MKSGSTPTTLPRYVAFDKITGRIVGAYSSFSVAAGKNVQVALDELNQFFSKDSAVIAELTDNDVSNLDIMELNSQSPPSPQSRVMVDILHKKVVAQPKISLTTRKHELLGDGVDSTSIEIEVLGGDGHVKRDFNSQVKVSTTRGKLSTRGGLVVVREGVGSITLTSAPETVSRVQVQVVALDALCAPSSIMLEFV